MADFLGGVPKWLFVAVFIVALLLVIYSFFTGIGFTWKPTIGFTQGFLRLKGSNAKVVGPFTVGYNSGHAWQSDQNPNLLLSSVDTGVDPSNGVCFVRGLTGPLNPNESVGFDVSAKTYRFVLWVGKGDPSAQTATAATAQCIEFQSDANSAK